MRAICLLAFLLSACTIAEEPPHTQAGRASANCRQDVDRAYEKQNRSSLSMPSMSGSPFSSTGLSGITTAGLSSEYHRDEMMDQCLKGSGAAVGPGRDTLSPSSAASPNDTVRMGP